MIATYKEPVTLDTLKAKGISKTAIALLEEFVSTGTIKFLEEEKKPIYQLLQVYGIGVQKRKS